VSEERIARLETAMADMAEAMVETRQDLRHMVEAATENRQDILRLYTAWPQQFSQMTTAADHVRQRVGTAEVSIVRELQRLHERFDALEKKL
jgi:hypothetical protein